MKKFGIYLAYPPTVDLRAEGLGRHLAEFLRGAQDRGDLRFVIACPSWASENLTELFEASGVMSDSFEIMSPPKKPLLLNLHLAYVAFKHRSLVRSSRVRAFHLRLRAVILEVISYMEEQLVGTRSIIKFGVFCLFSLPLASIWGGAQIGKIALNSSWILVRKAVSRFGKISLVSRSHARLLRMAKQPKEDSIVARLYRVMESGEASLLQALIRRSDVTAWYCPTAFWPHFNNIHAPRLICVPDVVLADFPVGFAPVGGQRFLNNFRQVEETIKGGQYFVTYSEDVKWRTLVERYQVDPDAVSVVPHGANRLDDLIVISGFGDDHSATDSLCRSLFKTALRKAINNGFAPIYSDGNVQFIFYASQFRPNKNILSLLKAYEYLLKRRYISHKLVLTGNPNSLPKIWQYIVQHNLVNDVLCLSGLSSQELAACYHLADLAVNPSLSEGGCPFTFTEALSVGTPVVMARIPVTEEVITSQDLQELMLFDPYDWKDIADRIEWGLKNRQLLLEKQKPFYEKLAQRTWRNVVDEYVEILDRISLTHCANDEHAA